MAAGWLVCPEQLVWRCILPYTLLNSCVTVEPCAGTHELRADWRRSKKIRADNSLVPGGPIAIGGLRPPNSWRGTPNSCRGVIAPGG